MKCYRPFKKRWFFAWFWSFFLQISFSPIKMVKIIIFRQHIGQKQYTRLKVWEIDKIQKNFFLKLGNFILAWVPIFERQKYIYQHVSPKGRFWGKEVGQLQKNFFFLKICHFVSNIHFESREAIKTRWATAFWNLTITKCQVFDTKLLSTIGSAWYIF